MFAHIPSDQHKGRSYMSYPISLISRIIAESRKHMYFFGYLYKCYSDQ